MTAPLLLFIYNRPESVKASLDSLRSCILAADTDLFIFSDGPKVSRSNDSYLVAKSREEAALGSFGFRTVTIFKSESNKGLANSIIDGVTLIAKTYDRFIVCEDDLLYSRYFLSYMNKALERYSGDMRVWQVHGHMISRNIMVLPQTSIETTFFRIRDCSWGWGSWSNRWLKADWNIDNLDVFVKNTGMCDIINSCGNEMMAHYNSQKNGVIDSWAIRWAINMFSYGGCSLAPINSYISMQHVETSTHISGDFEAYENDLLLSDSIPIFPENVQISLDKNEILYKSISKTSAPVVFSDRRPWFFDWLKYDTAVKCGKSLLDMEIPWIPFPAIDELSSLLGKGVKVLEYGCGGSTMFMLRHGCDVVSVEHDERWFKEVSERISREGLSKYSRMISCPPESGVMSDGEIGNPMAYAHPTTHPGCNFYKYAHQCDQFEDESFDVLVIDGRARCSCLSASLRKVKKDGVVVIDNTERKAQEYPDGINVDGEFVVKRGPVPSLPYNQWNETTFIYLRP